jgi:hypothetical protein
MTGSARELYDVLQSVGDLKPWEIDKASLPREFWIPGDWAVREGSTLDQRIASLGSIVSKKAGRPFHFERRRLPRDVVIVRGELSLKPLWDGAEAGVIEFYDVKNPFKIKPTLNHTTLAEMFYALQYTLARPVIVETAARDQQVTWRNHLYTKDPEQLARNLEKQTGLKFDREQRDCDIWVLVADDGGSAPAPQPYPRTVGSRQ